MIGRFNEPVKITDLKSERIWSLSFVREAFPNEQDDFLFLICRKEEGGGYLIVGQCTEPDDAFQLRRDLVSEYGPKLFIRARRRRHIVTEHNHEDAFRDALQSGDASNIPADQKPEFDKWASRVINERPEYARRNRDLPQWSNR